MEGVYAKLWSTRSLTSYCLFIDHSCGVCGVGGMGYHRLLAEALGVGSPGNQTQPEEMSLMRTGDINPDVGWGSLSLTARDGPTLWSELHDRGGIFE